MPGHEDVEGDIDMAELAIADEKKYHGASNGDSKYNNNSNETEWKEQPSPTPQSSISSSTLMSHARARRKKLKLDGAGKYVVNAVDTSQELQKHEYTTVQLAQSSDEGIRAIYLNESKVHAVIGDLHIKCWAAYHRPGYQLVKFKRQHNFGICAATTTLQHGMQTLLVAAGHLEGHLLDMSSLKQFNLNLVVPRRCVPSYFDGNRLSFVEKDMDTGSKVMWVYDCHTQERKQSFFFPKAHKHYWGFQLNGDRMIHVSCHNKIKVWDINNNHQPLFKLVAHADRVFSFLVDRYPAFSSQPSPTSSSQLSSPSPASPTSPTSAPAPASASAQLTATAIEGAEGLVEDALEIISFGADRKIKIWYNDRCVIKIRKLMGSWHRGHPYTVKRYGDYLFYTADEGIFVVKLPDNYRESVIKPIILAAEKEKEKGKRNAGKKDQGEAKNINTQHSNINDNADKTSTGHTEEKSNGERHTPSNKNINETNHETKNDDHIVNGGAP